MTYYFIERDGVVIRFETAQVLDPVFTVHLRPDETCARYEDRRFVRHHERRDVYIEVERQDMGRPT